MSSIEKLKNDSASLIIDLLGGAITKFNLNEKDINPLSFNYPKKSQMPANNKD